MQSRMQAHADTLLLNLSLELAAAKDALSAVEAFNRYLNQRFSPEFISHSDAAADSSDIAGFSGVFKDKGDSIHFLFRLAVPVVFTLRSIKSEKPNINELDAIEKMLRFFREKLDAFAELKGLTYTDDLTGLYNQRYLELILDRELSLAKRSDTEFSVLFLDLDHFKNVNDTHGHLIGSRLLFEVGEEIKKTLRESDITFRYGGDEFVIILSHTGLDAAVMVAERIRIQIEKKRFLARDNLDIRLTASIGVAAVPLHAATKQQILQAADEALYGVKKAVRNRVIAATSKVKE